MLRFIRNLPTAAVRACLLIDHASPATVAGGAIVGKVTGRFTDRYDRQPREGRGAG